MNNNNNDNKIGLAIDKVYRKMCKSDEFDNFMDLLNQSEYITEY